MGTFNRFSVAMADYCLRLLKINSVVVVVVHSPCARCGYVRVYIPPVVPADRQAVPLRRSRGLCPACPARGGASANFQHYRRGTEEVPSAIPIRRLIITHQPQIGFVHEGRRLQRLPGLFARQPRGRKLSQFVVDQGQEFLGGVRIAVINLFQKVSNTRHSSAHRDGQQPSDDCPQR
jgi:hypothetical protein